MNHCFTYGSLMCPDIMNDVCGSAFEGHNAQLTGYNRFSIRDEHYPGMIACERPSTDCAVQGVVYLNVTPMALKRLDEFEGEMYQRQTVEVFLADGKTITAQTYVIRPDFIDVLEDEPWSFEAFLKTGKPLFQSQYQGYRAIEAKFV